MNLTPEWVTAIATIILVFSTIIYVFFTYKLTKETVKLREVETSPFMSLHIDGSSWVLRLIIKNIGKAPAYNISFNIDKKFESYFSCGCSLKDKISYFAPNQEIFFSLGKFSDLEKIEEKSIPIKVVYYSKDNNKFEESFSLEWKHLSGTLTDTNRLDKIKKAIDETTKELKETNKILKVKEYIITNKLKILEFNKKDNSIEFVFSNGYVDNISLSRIQKLKMKSIDKIYLDGGDLYDYTTNTIFLAEEIYFRLQKMRRIK